MLVFFVEQGPGTARRETLMDAVRGNRSHRPGSSLNKVGPSQLNCVHFDTKNFCKGLLGSGQNGFTGTSTPENS